MKKRQFLKSFGNTLMISPFLSFDLRNNDNDLYSDRSLLNDKEFWNRIRKDYSLKKDYINLENGYYNIIPNPTLKKFISHVKSVNFALLGKQTSARRFAITLKPSEYNTPNDINHT